jgi:adenylate kinase
VRAVVVGTTGVNMRALAASLDSFHKEQGRGGLGLYFEEDELRREVDWVNFLDSDDYFWQERVWREAVSRAIGRAEEEAAEHALLFMNPPTSGKAASSPPSTSPSSGRLSRTCC